MQDYVTAVCMVLVAIPWTCALLISEEGRIRRASEKTLNHWLLYGSLLWTGMLLIFLLLSVNRPYDRPPPPDLGWQILRLAMIAVGLPAALGFTSLVANVTGHRTPGEVLAGLLSPNRGKAAHGIAYGVLGVGLLLPTILMLILVWAIAMGVWVLIVWGALKVQDPDASLIATVLSFVTVAGIGVGMLVSSLRRHNHQPPIPSGSVA